jgi:hypothetical protein
VALHALDMHLLCMLDVNCFETLEVSWKTHKLFKALDRGSQSISIYAVIFSSSSTVLIVTISRLHQNCPVLMLDIRGFLAHIEIQFTLAVHSLDVFCYSLNEDAFNFLNDLCL